MRVGGGEGVDRCNIATLRALQHVGGGAGERVGGVCVAGEGGRGGGGVVAKMIVGQISQE